MSFESPGLARPASTRKHRSRRYSHELNITHINAVVFIVSASCVCIVGRLNSPPINVAPTIHRHWNAIATAPVRRSPQVYCEHHGVQASAVCLLTCTCWCVNGVVAKRSVTRSPRRRSSPSSPRPPRIPTPLTSPRVSSPLASPRTTTTADTADSDSE